MKSFSTVCLVSGLLFLLAAACPARAAESRFFSSAGVTLRYLVEGEGEPVLLIHGLGASVHLQWVAPGVIQALAKDHRVIAYDNRGHGRSGKPHDPQRYGEETVADAVRLLDHLGIRQAHIVGYSMGALITNKLLMEHPDRFLSATLGGAGWLKSDDERAVFMQDVIESLEQSKGILPLLVRLTPPGQPKPTEDQFRVRLGNRVFALLNDQRALAAAARGMSELAVTEDQLRANRVPTLALVGGADPLKVTVDELAQVMPHLTVTVIEDADHLRAPGRPEFVRELKSFLSQHAAK
ncbi:MAG TPA: alpha/beta hydrolase [Pirellulales bacterium]|jgi:pimeloyl-ACP methyl ester carboxylesterase|nr:alpha/beta hydrolase [Pirellulales bacterium]